MAKDALAVVLARGGSKRVPGKNVRLLHGQPMVSWPVRTAVESGLFADVQISTDDEAIAAAAVAAGASRPFVRPASLSDDHTGSRAVLRHALIMEKESKGLVPQYVCMLYGTSAFVTNDILQQGYAKIQEGASRVMCVAAYPHPIERAYQKRLENGVEFLAKNQPEYATVRTQDLEEKYYDVGLAYWFKSEDVLAQRDVEGHVRGIKLPRYLAVDIDTEEDFALAELVAQRLWGK